MKLMNLVHSSHSRDVKVFRSAVSQMEDAGVRVLDDRLAISGKIWAYVADTSDGQHRMLVRKLLAVGIEFSPGKGYWK